MKIGVYGLGAFGVFWAKELAKHYDVICCSRSKKEISGLNIVDLDKFCKESDIIFICSTMNSINSVVKMFAENISDTTIIADTCSVKLYPLAAMEKYLQKGKFVATHPMFGPQSGANGVQNLPIMLDALGNSELENMFMDIFNKMELKIVKMTCDEHDKQVAYSQALNHFLGRSLARLGLQEVEIATYGYSHLLNIVEYIGNNAIELFHDMQNFNPYAKQMRDDLFKAIKDTSDAVLEAKRTS